MTGVRQFDEVAALEKALALFWQNGFSETSMQELAAATGVQRGSLYNAYQGKETLFLRAFEMYRQRYLLQIRASLDKPTLREALDSFFDFIIGSMTTGAPTRGCLTTKTAVGGGAVIDEPIREALKGMIDEFETILWERFARAEDDAHLMLPPEEAARLVITMTRGIVVIERIYRDKERLRTTADMLTSLLLRAA